MTLDVDADFESWVPDVDVYFESWGPGDFRARAAATVDGARWEGVSGGVRGVTPMQAVHNAIYHLLRAAFSPEVARAIERATSS